MYKYKCVIKRVVDGDTVDVNIDLGFDTWLFDQRIRLAGVDTPEIRTRDLEEKKFGYLAMDFVMKHLPVGSEQTLVSDEYDSAKGKFGRILGKFLVLDDTAYLNDLLIQEHLGVAYHGQNRDEVEAEHLKNRELLEDNS